MSWTDPRTWLYKEKPSYATFNTHIRDNLNYLKDLFNISTGHNHAGGTDDGAPIPEDGLVDGPFVPIGGIIMWWSDNTVPTNWEVCDGTTVATSGSPLIGLTKPNLTNKMVRGVANSNIRSTPSNGGTDSHSHTVNSHSHVITMDGAHSHTVDSHYHDVYGECNGNYGGGCGNAANGAAGHGQSGLASPGTSNPGAYHDHYTNTSSVAPGMDTQNNIPAYIGLVFIMRVK